MSAADDEAVVSWHQPERVPFHIEIRAGPPWVGDTEGGRRRGCDSWRMQELLHAHQLVKDFRGNRAVDGVDFALHQGERLGLLGPNGAGKTTTLFMLLGVIQPDDGWVR